MLRLLAFLAVAALAAALLFGACLAACGVAVVSVVAEEAPHIVAPIPLVLPIAAVEFLPEHVIHEIQEGLGGDGGPALVALGALLESLEGVESAVLARIEDGDAHVLVAKEEDDLVVRVREKGASGRVFVRAPIRALREAAAACAPVADGEGDSGSWSFADGAPVRCDGRALARAIVRFARGAEVEVRDRTNRVDISVW